MVVAILMEKVGVIDCLSVGDHIVVDGGDEDMAPVFTDAAGFHQGEVAVIFISQVIERSEEEDDIERLVIELAEVQRREVVDFQIVKIGFFDLALQFLEVGEGWLKGGDVIALLSKIEGIGTGARTNIYNGHVLGQDGLNRFNRGNKLDLAGSVKEAALFVKGGVDGIEVVSILLS